MSRLRPIRLGILADTHGLFDPVILQHFRGVDHIIHAGDIGRSTVIDCLKSIAPVTAVSGNIDEKEDDRFPSEAVLELSGYHIAIRHILYEGGKITKEGRIFLDRTRPDICIFGHTHQPRKEWLGDTLLFNPGSAGPKRFKLPRGLGLLTISEHQVTTCHVALTDRMGEPHSASRNLTSAVRLATVGKRKRHLD